MNKLNFIIRLYKRYGARGVWFMVRLRFVKNKTSGIRLRGVKYPVALSNLREDFATMAQIFFKEEYSIPNLTAPRFIIDCGANIGLSAVYFANKYPSAKIIAIEPDSNNFRFLKSNTRYYFNITCIQKAIWPENIMLQISDPGRGNWGLQTKPKEESLANNSVQGITLDELINQFDIDKIGLLKIDIEGAEKDLFSSNYDEWLDKVEVMAIELHDFLDPTISPVFYKAIEPYHFKQSNQGENLILERV